MHVKLKKETSEKSIIKISVSDTGIGIPEDKKEEIFLRFNRLSPSYKGIYKGAGLALSIVKQFVDNLNGEIFVESEEGKGTTIGCYIPFQNPFIVNL